MVQGEGLSCAKGPWQEEALLFEELRKKASTAGQRWGGEADAGGMNGGTLQGLMGLTEFDLYI